MPHAPDRRLPEQCNEGTEGVTTYPGRRKYRRKQTHFVLVYDSGDQPWADWIASWAARFFQNVTHIHFDGETIPETSFWRDLARTSRSLRVAILVSSHLVPHYGSERWLQLWRKDMRLCKSPAIPIEVEALAPKVIAGLGSIAWHFGRVALHGKDEDEARLTLDDWLFRPSELERPGPIFPGTFPASRGRTIRDELLTEHIQILVIVRVTALLGAFADRVLGFSDCEVARLAEAMVQVILEAVAPHLLTSAGVFAAKGITRAVSRITGMLQDQALTLAYSDNAATTREHLALEALLIVLQETCPDYLAP